MKATFKGVIDPIELNELLATVGWEVENQDFLEDSLNRSWGWVTLRDENATLRGFVQLISDDEQEVTIYLFLVHKAYQGLGFGTQLFKRVLEILKEEQVVLRPPLGAENQGVLGYFDDQQQNGRKTLFMGN